MLFRTVDFDTGSKIGRAKLRGRRALVSNAVDTPATQQYGLREPREDKPFRT